MTYAIADPLFNPLVLLGMGILCVGFIYGTFRINRDHLFGVIGLLLLLITVAGAKIAPFFGHQSNTGNIFYASVFLATYFLIERYGKRAGFRSIWIGVAFVAFFELLLRLAVLLNGSESSSAINDALATAFGSSLRLAFASLLAYACAQSVNVVIFTELKAWWDGRYIWLRANLANAVAQIVDSIIFFSVAFWGAVPPGGVFDIIVTGYLIKVCFMVFAAPVLYANTVEEGDERSSLTLTFWR